ncbi:hypothetical protein KC317_g15813, partial [Hortaea werneckii]
MAFTGSPQKKLAASFSIYEDAGNGADGQQSLKRNTSVYPPPLTTSKLQNQLPPTTSSKKIQGPSFEKSSVEALLNRISEQQALQSRQKQQVENDTEDTSSSSTDPYATTPPTAGLANSDDRPDAAEVLRLKKELALATERMAQMDLQLTKERQDRMSQAEIDELTQSRIAQHTVEQAIGSPFPG